MIANKTPAILYGRRYHVRHHDEMKLRNKIRLAALLIAVTGLATVFVLLGGPESMARRHRFERYVKCGNHAAIAQAAIAMISKTTSQQMYTARSDDERSLTNLPAIIRDMKPNWVSVEPGHMTIEFHGGFDHFGFNIDKSDYEWEMSWYSEGDKGDHRILGGHYEETNTANQAMQQRPDLGK